MAIIVHIKIASLERKSIAGFFVRVMVSTWSSTN
jgi:hypothetical protein